MFLIVCKKFIEEDVILQWNSDLIVLNTALDRLVLLQACGYHLYVSLLLLVLDVIDHVDLCLTRWFHTVSAYKLD